MGWHVIFVETGKEDMVYTQINNILNHVNYTDYDLLIPKRKLQERHQGKFIEIVKKMFPGYVLIHMIMNDDTWYVVRNTRGVTGFVGPGSKPVALSEAEMERLGIQNVVVQIDFEVGDSVVITSGAWKDTESVIQSINEAKRTVTINVEMMGRETPLEIGFAEVKKL